MRKIRAGGSGSMVVWGWVAGSILLVAVDTDRVCGQFYRPVVAPAGPSAQDFANAKAMSDATAKAQWWTSALVLVAFGGFVYYFGRPVFSFLKTMADEFSRGPATTDPKKLALSDPWMHAPLAQLKDSDRTGPATEPVSAVQPETTPPQDS